MPYESFTSLPPEEERTFEVYEQRMRTAEQLSKRVGLGVAFGTAALLILIIIGFWGPLKPIINDPTEKPAAAAAVAPAAAPAPAPAAAPAAAPAPAPAAAAPATP